MEQFVPQGVGLHALKVLEEAKALEGSLQKRIDSLQSRLGYLEDPEKIYSSLNMRSPPIERRWSDAIHDQSIHRRKGPEARRDMQDVLLHGEERVRPTHGGQWQSGGGGAGAQRVRNGCTTGAQRVRNGSTTGSQQVAKEVEVTRLGTMVGLAQVETTC
jgi:hypothetical protein